MKSPTSGVRALLLAIACSIPLVAANSAAAGNEAPIPQVSALTREQAAELFAQGERYERSHDLHAAMGAYAAAAEAGDGYAQKKLGDFYGSGNAAVERDYETSLKWYELARDQGIPVPTPATNPGDFRFPSPVMR